MTFRRMQVSKKYEKTWTIPVKEFIVNKAVC